MNNINIRLSKYGYELELADIFRDHWDEFKNTTKLTKQQKKSAFAIMHCRTANMGYHKEKCNNDSCDYEVIAHNSCRDRNCNKCESNKRLKWVTDRLKELLPIFYYHVVCTMPPRLHRLCLYNQAVIYDLFFKATSYTLNAFSRDTKFLGAQLGFPGVLHTWGQKLNYHPHIHYIVTGGGLAWDKSSWKRLPYTDKFLFPVTAMSETIRDTFTQLLQQAYSEGRLEFPGKLMSISSAYDFDRFCDRLGQDAWYCYAKPPFSGPQKVMEYLGRYTHRVAISNRRLIKVEGGRVYFEWRDYKDEGRIKVTSLPVFTFMQRFLLHVVPSGFRKIRYYGFLSTVWRKEKLEIVRELLDHFTEDVKQAIQQWLDKIDRYINHMCPKCGSGQLVFYYDTS